MCAKEKEDKKLLKNEINVEYTQNSVRRLLVREYVYFRKLKGLTQAEVAERAGISRTNILGLKVENITNIRYVGEVSNCNGFRYFSDVRFQENGWRA